MEKAVAGEVLRTQVAKGRAKHTEGGKDDVEKHSVTHLGSLSESFHKLDSSGST